MTDELMTISEVAAAIRVPEATLRYYRHLGDKGPRSFRAGRRILYKAADVQAWVDERYSEASGGRHAT